MQSLSPSDIKKLQNSMFRAVDFIQNFLPDPMDSTKLCKLTNSQIDAIDSVQFGFPLRNYNFSEVKKAPRGVVMVWPRQTGKSEGCAYAAVALALIKKNCNIGIISRSIKDARKLMKKIKRILKHSIFKDFVVHKTERLDYVELLNGNEIESWPCSDDIRGSTYMYLFADEAAIIEEEILYEAALPTVTHGKRWIMLSTPRGNKGKFIDYYFKGLKTRPIICKKCGQKYPQAAFRADDFPSDKMPDKKLMHPCVNCGAFDYKYGVGIFAVPVVDPWNDGIRDKKWLKDVMEEHDWSPAAKQEYLGKVISEGALVFLVKWLDQCTDGNLRNVRKKKKGISYVIGVDYGKKVDASCFYVTHQEDNGQIVLDYAMSVAGEFDYEKEYSHIRADLLKLIAYYNPVWVVPDATGVGDPLVEDLERDINSLKRNKALEVEDLHGKKTRIFAKERIRTRIYNSRDDHNVDKSKPTNNKGFLISIKTKPALIGELISKFRNMNIRIPDRSEPEIGKLREELIRFESEWKPGTNYIKYGTQSFHDDRVIALALSVWGHRRKPFILDDIRPVGGIYNTNEGWT